MAVAPMQGTKLLIRSETLLSIQSVLQYLYAQLLTHILAEQIRFWYLAQGHLGIGDQYL